MLRSALRRRPICAWQAGATQRLKRSSSLRPPAFLEADDESEYVDEFDWEDETHSHSTREHLNLVRIPHGLNAALREHTLPVLRSRRKLIDTRPTVHEFAAHRLDLAYAASQRVLQEACARLPGLAAPARALDFGAGLSPLAWALGERWPDDAPLTVAVEPNDRLRALGSQLAASDGVRVRWSSRLPAEEEGEFEWVNASYALSALERPAREDAIAALWARTSPGGLLALLEPATAAGFGMCDTHTHCSSPSTDILSSWCRTLPMTQLQFCTRVRSSSRAAVSPRHKEPS